MARSGRFVDYLYGCVHDFLVWREPSPYFLGSQAGIARAQRDRAGKNLLAHPPHVQVGDAVAARRMFFLYRLHDLVHHRVVHLAVEQDVGGTAQDVLHPDRHDNAADEALGDVGGESDEEPAAALDADLADVEVDE